MTITKLQARRYWTETAAAREFGIPATTLRHVWERREIETIKTACGLTLLYGPSVLQYKKKFYQPRRRDIRVYRHRAAHPRKGIVHAIMASSLPDGPALCGSRATWGPRIRSRKQPITCERCQQRAASKIVS